MIKFTSYDREGDMTTYSYLNVTELKEQYCSSEYFTPYVDDPVTEVSIHGVPIYIQTFYGLLKLLGIVDGGIKC